MATRRIAIASVACALIVAAPACRFDRGDDQASNSSSSSSSTVDVFGDETTSSLEETTTTLDGSATTRSASTVRASTATTARRTTPPPPPPPPPAPTVPHCNVTAASGGDGRWTASVTSTFPNSAINMRVTWAGGSGDYNDFTDASGSWTKTRTQRNQSMVGQRVTVSVSVGGRNCSTSFTG